MTISKKIWLTFYHLFEFETKSLEPNAIARRRDNILNGVLIGVIVLVGIALAVYVVRFRYASHYGAETKASFGTFGDYFGGVVNPITGLLTVVLLVKGYLAQRRELAQADQDAQAARQHNEAMRRQGQTQGVTQTLFSWIGSYDALVESLAGPRGGNGRPTLEKWYRRRLSEGQVGIQMYSPNSTRKKEPDFVVSHAGLWKLGTIQTTDVDAFAEETTKVSLLLFEKLYRKKRASLDSIFRTLYRLIRWLDTVEGLQLNERYEFVAIVRSRLSWIEQAYLLLNCATHRGAKLAKLANKYALFDNFEVDSGTPFWYIKHHLLGSLNSAPSLNKTAFSSDEAKKSWGSESGLVEPMVLKTRHLLIP